MEALSTELNFLAIDLNTKEVQKNVSFHLLDCIYGTKPFEST